MSISCLSKWAFSEQLFLLVYTEKWSQKLRLKTKNFGFKHMMSFSCRILERKASFAAHRLMKSIGRRQSFFYEIELSALKFKTNLKGRQEQKLQVKKESKIKFRKRKAFQAGQAWASSIFDLFSFLIPVTSHAWEDQRITPNSTHWSDSLQTLWIS